MKREIFFSSQDLISLAVHVRDIVIYAFYLRENALNGLECGKTYKEASGLLAQAAGVFLHLESSENDASYGCLKEIALMEASELYFLQAKKDGRFSNSLITKMCVSISEGFGRIPKTYKELPLHIKSVASAKKLYYESVSNFYAAETEEIEKLKYARYCLAFQLSEKSIRIFKKLEYPGLLYKVESWKATLHAKIPSPNKLQMIWNNVPPLQPFDGPIVNCTEFTLSEFTLPTDLPEFLNSYLVKTKPRMKSLERIKTESRPIKIEPVADIGQEESLHDSLNTLVSDLSDVLVNCRKSLWELESDFSMQVINSKDVSNTVKDINNILDEHEQSFRKITNVYSNNAVQKSKSLVKPHYDSSKQLDPGHSTSNTSLAVLKYELDSVISLENRIKALKNQLKINSELSKFDHIYSLNTAKKESFIKTVWHSLSRKPKGAPSRGLTEQFSQTPNGQVGPKKGLEQHSRFFTQQSSTSIKVPRLRSRTNDRVLKWLNTRPSETEFAYPVLY